jgi:hypothetical protein
MAHYLRNHHQMQHLTYRNEEARKKNIEHGQKQYPWADWNRIDYEVVDLTRLPKADIIFNMGLQYHLSSERCRPVLEATIARATRIAFLETEVVDCTRCPCWLARKCEKSRYDQGTVDYEISPSVRLITDTLDRIDGIQYEMIEDESLNWYTSPKGYVPGERCGYVYHWPLKNTRTCIPGHRKLWVIKKEPLREE